MQRLDAAGGHLARQHRLFEQVHQRLGDQPALALLADEVPRPADALQAARDVARRLHLTHQVHRPHVDAEFQRRGRDHRLQNAVLQRLLNLLPHLQRHAAVVRLRPRCLRLVVGGQHVRVAGMGRVALLVQMGGDALDTAAVVGEHDGRTVLGDQLRQQPVDRRPDRLFRQRPEVLDGAEHTQIEVFPQPGVHDGDRPRRHGAVRGNVAAAKVVGDHFQRPLRRGQADAHEAARVQRLQPLQQQRQENAALVRTQGVNLIDDDVRHARQCFTGARGQQQVQRFRRGDEHVRRPAQQPLSLRGGRVAGAHGHVNRRQLLTEFLRRRGDAGQRHLQIAVNVVVQCLQRRDVQDADAARQFGLTPEVIEAGEERGQRFAGAGRGEDERVLPGGNERPALTLRRRWFAERGTEPVPDGRQKQIERVSVTHADRPCRRKWRRRIVRR